MYLYFVNILCKTIRVSRFKKYNYNNKYYYIVNNLKRHDINMYNHNG